MKPGNGMRPTQHTIEFEMFFVWEIVFRFLAWLLPVRMQRVPVVVRTPAIQGGTSRYVTVFGHGNHGLHGTNGRLAQAFNPHHALLKRTDPWNSWSLNNRNLIDTR